MINDSDKDNIEPVSGAEPTYIKKPADQSSKKIAGYIGAIVVNAILLYIFNNLYRWGLPFLTSNYNEVLSIIRISLSVTIAANFIFLFYNPKWFEALLKIGLNVIALIVIQRIWTVYSFDFSGVGFNIDFWVKLGLLLAAADVIIALIVEIVRFILAFARRSV